MKTKMNISVLKKATVAFFAAILIGAAVYAQPTPEPSENIASDAIARLDAINRSNEASLRYVAPKNVVSNEVASSLEQLNVLVAVTNASLKYTTPSVEESDALESLREINKTIESTLVYKAPRTGEVNTDQGTESDNLQMLAFSQK